jgi:branched-chain amino acid transport system ATP-binding protein
MTAVFEANHLQMRFGNRIVLEDITLRFGAGELCGIMGPNGAGKTTCFNVLTGRYRPTRGQVTLDGEDITGLSPHAIARKGVSRSFQIMNLFNDFSARDNIVTGLPELRRQGVNMHDSVAATRALADKAEGLLERVGLAGKGDVLAKNLSYGDRRALEIGVALAAAPRILFLDEPTAGLGSDGTARLTALIRSLKGQLTIVMIEHDMHFLFGLADRISVIHWGQVVAQGTPAALRNNDWVRNSNLGKLQ